MPGMHLRLYALLNLLSLLYFCFKFTINKERILNLKKQEIQDIFIETN